MTYRLTYERCVTQRGTSLHRFTLSDGPLSVSNDYLPRFIPSFDEMIEQLIIDHNLAAERATANLIKWGKNRRHTHMYHETGRYTPIRSDRR